jgi:hypothetical protein
MCIISFKGNMFQKRNEADWISVSGRTRYPNLVVLARELSGVYGRSEEGPFVTQSAHKHCKNTATTLHNFQKMLYAGIIRKMRIPCCQKVTL